VCWPREEKIGPHGIFWNFQGGGRLEESEFSRNSWKVKKKKKKKKKKTAQCRLLG